MNQDPGSRGVVSSLTVVVSELYIDRNLLTVVFLLPWSSSTAGIVAADEYVTITTVMGNRRNRNR